MSERPKLLQASGLTKRFFYPTPTEIFKDVDLEVEEGETIAIVGASGEGKSTLLHVLGTLETPCEGEVTIAGQRVTTSKAPFIRNNYIGFIFQSFFLLEDYTALGNVLMPARIARRPCRPSTPAYEKAQELLCHVGLQDRMHFPAKLLSGGEKQRVAIARALSNDPLVILADEPSGNLDHKTSHHIHDLLLGLVQESGKAMITVTHDSELASLCDKVYTLSDRKLVRTS